MVGVKSEKINHKNCTPREPNGQNELSSVEERGKGLAGLENPVFICNKCPLRRPLLLVPDECDSRGKSDGTCTDRRGHPPLGMVTWAIWRLESPLLVLSSVP